ncbi:hypothetical protein T4D_256 [Trichinella pseudospiralis]|uniref:Uncharacterized protein n=1 Tax=Trichinella pseudospiralis TaxID=6337 RepID=A0A0V1FYW5_TRIPS|nr:hypothetical protein T4D_15385 [Trichinella pseudospiralis]KRY91182.1 hypothetical protein T4D_256 [Trichinella pseudospiralis]
MGFGGTLPQRCGTHNALITQKLSLSTPFKRSSTRINLRCSFRWLKPEMVICSFGPLSPRLSTTSLFTNERCAPESRMQLTVLFIPFSAQIIARAICKLPFE